MKVSVRMKKSITWFFVCVSLNLSASNDLDIDAPENYNNDAGFLFTIPHTLIMGLNETVCLSLHGSSGPSKVLVDLKVKEKHYITPRNLITEHTCFELFVPILNTKGPIYANIQVQVMLNATVLTSHNQDPILIYPNSDITIITTDRNIYKPGDRVKMRMLVLNQELKSRSNHVIPIVKIKNPMDVTVSVWRNLETDLGLVQLEYQISKETVEGKWSIEANGEFKTFDVRKHVLPRFIVTLKYPKLIYTGGTFVTFEICAKYFYGKNINGSALIKITDSKNNLTPLTRMKKLSKGCSTFTFSNEDLYLQNIRSKEHEWQQMSNLEHVKKLNIIGLVTEAGTNQVEIEEGHSVFTFNIYEMKFEFEQDYFQPGLPFHGRLVLHNIQEELKKEVVEICYTVAVKRSWNVQQVNPCTNFTVGSDNSIDFHILPLRSNVIGVYLTARSLNHTNVKFIGPQEIKRLHSSSGSYIKIEENREELNDCKHSQHFFVHFTTDRVRNQDNLTFFYMVKSRNKIIKLRKINRQVNKQARNYLNEMANIVGTKIKHTKLGVTSDKFSIKFRLDNTTISKYKLLVYIVLPNNEVIASVKEVSMHECLTPTVKSSLSNEQYSPGETAKLIIATKPNSLCSVTAVDKATRHLTKSKIFDSRSFFDFFSMERESKETSRITCVRHERKHLLDLGEFEATTVAAPFELRRKRHVYQFAEDMDAFDLFTQYGIVAITNLKIITKPCYDGPIFYDADVGDNISALSYTKQYDVNDEDKTVHLRSYFPETWLWELVYVNNDGYGELTREVPHSLTTWMGNVMCISPEHEIALSKTTETTVFQPFFINVLAPFSLKRNEVLYLYVKLFNYLDYNLPIHVKLLDVSGLEMLDKPSEDSKCILSEESVDYVYRIKATKLGRLNITVTAELDSSFPGVCGPELIINKRDAVSKIILVEPEGFPVESTQSSLLCAQDSMSQNVTWHMSIPRYDALVPNTERSILHFNADLLGQMIENLEKLMNIPTGCGEQVMAKLAPNLYALKYLSSIKKLDQTSRKRAIRNIKIGYQKILKFMHRDGSFSAFGTSDPTGSMFLTAFVVKCLSQAKPYIYIDASVLNKAVEWIFQHQLENGCFASMYHVFQDMGGTTNENSTAGLTAYVLISLSVSNIDIPSDVISNAKYCIQAHRSPDKYTLAISTYASLLMGWKEEADRLFPRILQDMSSKLVSHGSSTQIETMGYMLLALMHHNNPEYLAHAHSIVRWLTSKRNANGVFRSTQDTIVALEALEKYSVFIKQDVSLKIRITTMNQDQEIEINEDDKLKTKRVNLLQAENVVTVSVEGKGCVLAQAVLAFNTYNQTKGQSYQLEMNVRAVSTTDGCSVTALTPCVAYFGNSNEAISNMAVLEIDMPSGYIPDRSTLYRLTSETNKNIKMFEELDNKVVIYLTKVTQETICTPFIINEGSVVASRSNSTIKVFDYYNPEQMVSKYFYINDCNAKEQTALPELQILPNATAIEN